MDTKNNKQLLLEKLYEPYKKCIACPLGMQGRTQVVFGEGNPEATLMFIGEGPGQEEDKQGRPFVGRSGQLLNRILHMLDLQRSEVFISNVVKCRPPGNRKPTQLESSTCKNLLLFKQIEIIQPKVLCTLGATALEGLLDNEVKMSQLRGSQIPFGNALIVPTFHPAYILRNPSQLEKMIMDIERATLLSKME